MKYLLDTHVILWVLIGDERITKDVKNILLDVNNQIYYSTVSTWEVEIKHQKFNTFSFTGEQMSFLCDQNFMLNLPIRNSHVNRLKDVYLKDIYTEHKDPFDKMLLSQAIEEKMIFITHDKKFKNYNRNDIIFI